MDREELKDRTKQFALRIIKLVAALPKTLLGKVIGGQLIRCGTAVGANYRAACRARSTAEFISRIATVEEEADECVWWLELIIASDLLPAHLVTPLLDEANQLTAIFTAIGRTSKRNHPRSATAKPKSQLPTPKSQIRNPKSETH